MYTVIGDIPSSSRVEAMDISPFYRQEKDFER